MCILWGEGGEAGQDKRPATFLPDVRKTYETDLECASSRGMEMLQGVLMTKKANSKTKAQLDKDADRRLQKTYNKDLAWYDKQLAEQNYGCAICGRPAGTRRLHVDHDHGWKKVKIASEKFKDGWSAVATYNGVEYVGFNSKKSLAVRKVKRDLLGASVRGLLCYTHNAGLQKFADSSELLRSAAIYLENFQKGSPLSGQEKQ